jgi:hypothetical protein
VDHSVRLQSSVLLFFFYAVTHNSGEHIYSADIFGNGRSLSR